MFRNKFLTDISISTIQVILNQLTGVVVFFIITSYLDKTSLGNINWVMALLTVVISVLGFGLEHIAVRKAATGEDIGSLLQCYLSHTIIASAGLLFCVWLAQRQFVWLQQEGSFFFWLALAQCVGFIAIPFRHIANGLEKFREFFFMSSSANIVKLVLLLVLASLREITLNMIVGVYLIASIAELFICLLIFRLGLKLPLRIGFNRKAYLVFVKEALPQFGVNVFNTAMARMDWVLLGLLSTAIMVADYSVVNKLFELATLPLLVAAPVLFPRIAKMFGVDKYQSVVEREAFVKMLIKMEIMVSVYIAMILNLCWEPLIDPLTANRYGAATIHIFLVMSFAMPLVYLNNIFWSILFSQQQMRKLLLIFLMGFLVNLLADAVLIPFYQAIGAAIGYVLALLVQVIMYSWYLSMPGLKHSAMRLIPVVVFAICSGMLGNWLFGFFVWKLITATAIYLLLMVLTGQIRLTDWQAAKKYWQFNQG